MEKSELPPAKRNAWLFIYVGFFLLAATAVVLSILYRDAPKSGEVINKQQKKGADRVVYAVVYSSVPEETIDTVIAGIVADIGADSAKTNLIVGSFVTDPWCANIGEYKRVLRKAMSETKPLHIGKQTYILSMVTGLITKEQLPARVYLIGTLDSTADVKVMQRTAQTVNALQLRHETLSPVSVTSYLRPTTSQVHAAYLRQFEDKVFPLSQR